MMKNMVLLILSLIVATDLSSQDLKTTIQEKVWRLNESYLDNDPVEDTLYIYFTYNYLFKSAATPGELSAPLPTSFSLGEPSVMVAPPDQPTFNVVGNSITINVGEEAYAFDVVYFDNDDLIVVMQDSLVYHDDDGDIVFPYTIEMRFVLDN